MDLIKNDEDRVRELEKNAKEINSKVSGEALGVLFNDIKKILLSDNAINKNEKIILDTLESCWSKK